MYLEIFPSDYVVFRVFGGILRDFAEIPEFRGSTTMRNIRSPVKFINSLFFFFCFEVRIADFLAEQTDQFKFLGNCPPVDPSPKLTLTLTSHLGQKFELGEG